MSSSFSRGSKKNCQGSIKRFDINCYIDCLKYSSNHSRILIDLRQQEFERKKEASPISFEKTLTRSVLFLRICYRRLPFVRFQQRTFKLASDETSCCRFTRRGFQTRRRSNPKLSSLLMREWEEVKGLGTVRER